MTVPKNVDVWTVFLKVVKVRGLILKKIKDKLIHCYHINMNNGI